MTIRTMEQGKIIKTFTSKTGKSVVLRYPKWDDLQDMLDFANGLIREDTFVELHGKEQTLEEEKKHLEKILENIEKGKQVHLEVFVEGKYAGNGTVRIASNRRQHVGEIGIALAKEFRGDGIGKELMNTLIDEAKKAGLKLLTISCFENNTQACYLYQKLGFKKAGTYPNAIKWKDGYVGEVHFYLPLN